MHEYSKSTPKVSKSKISMKVSSHTRQKFLTRIQTRETTPINNLHQKTPSNLYEYRKSVKEHVKPFVLDAQSPDIILKQISERTKKNLRNIFRWRLNTQTSLNTFEDPKKAKFRTSSMITLPKQEAILGSKADFYKYDDSLAFKNGREDLVKLYFNYNSNF